MTNFFLLLLNLQLSLVVGYAILERRGAAAYRKEARGLLGSIDDSALATWARAAGKTRSGLDADLHRVVRGQRAVVAGIGADKQEAGNGENGEDFAHAASLNNRQDGV